MTSTPDGLELRAGPLRLALRPDVGGSIAGLWHHDLPVLRSIEPGALSNARAAGAYALVPYSNRIGYSRFPWAGRTWSTRPNFDDSRHSVHGVGYQRAWEVVASDTSSATLRLHHRPDEDWPFEFEAVHQIELGESGLSLGLTLTNRGDAEAPFGLGWHPHFPKRTRSRIHAELSGRWDLDEALLPVRHVVQQHGIDGDVAHLRYDNVFTGWQQSARIRDERFSMLLTSSLPYLVVYTPELYDFYCVEPVSHVSNALNLDDPSGHGVVSLAPGASTSAWMKLQIEEAR
ncbi:aldose 1-epimerase [Caldimonas brevitalea]|nr:aldose 1-epimerase [Caldimonas brevitalea]